MRLLTALAFSAALPGAALAQDILPCDWQASAQALVEPWHETSRTFSNGAVRLALLDTVEPAAGAFWLLLLSPPYSELGDRQCRVIGWRGSGFSGIDFSGLDAGYDPAIGLTFFLPVQIYDPQSGGFLWDTLGLSLNQATGAVDAWVSDG